MAESIEIVKPPQCNLVVGAEEDFEEISFAPEEIKSLEHVLAARVFSLSFARKSWYSKNPYKSNCSAYVSSKVSSVTSEDAEDRLGE